jgi:hypothetical protein
MNLRDLPKKKLFTTPDRYFDELPMRIQKRIREREAISRPLPDWQPRWRMAIAGLLLLALAVPAWWFGQGSRSQSPEDILVRVSTEDVLAYLIAGGMEAEDILDHMALNDVEITLDPEMPALIPDEIDEREMEDIISAYGLEDELL